jgi:hypothetical protein
LHEDRSWHLVGVELTCCLLHCSLVWAWALGSLTTRRSWAKIILVVPEPERALYGLCGAFGGLLGRAARGLLRPKVWVAARIARRWDHAHRPGAGIGCAGPRPQHQVNTAHHNAPPDQSDRPDRTPGRLKDWLTRSGPRHSDGERRSQHIRALNRVSQGGLGTPSWLPSWPRPAKGGWNGCWRRCSGSRAGRPTS